MKPHIVPRKMFRGRYLTVVCRVRRFSFDFRLLSLFLISEKSRYMIKKKKNRAVALKRNCEKKEQLSSRLLFPGFSGNLIKWNFMVDFCSQFLKLRPNYVPSKCFQKYVSCHSASVVPRSLSEIGRLIIDKVRVSTIKTNIMLPILHHQP